jgi:hypothetical protein
MNKYKHRITGDYAEQSNSEYYKLQSDNRVIPARLIERSGDWELVKPPKKVITHVSVPIEMVNELVELLGEVHDLLYDERDNLTYNTDKWSKFVRMENASETIKFDLIDLVESEENND